jgi:lysophospholipase L1-like esterase
VSVVTGFWKLIDQKDHKMITRFLTAGLAALALSALPVSAANLTNYTYLALGDSISYGYDPTVVAPAPAKFTGFPEIVAAAEHLLIPKKEVNASCPGQSSSSFLNQYVPDVGCLGFKDSIRLHVSYPDTESQLQFAVSQLLANKQINLVTMTLGGNDLTLLEEECSAAPDFAVCVAGMLPGVMTTYGQNLTQILTALRTQANYTGQIILVTTYSPSADPLFIAAVGAVDGVMVSVGAQFGATIADGFTAFLTASIPYLGDPCAAGLLVRLSPTTCDVHPSHAGQQLLAATVLSVISGR